jgi:Ca-activated chloride channel family protein
MGRGSEYRVLLEVVIPPFSPGTYQIANLGLNYVTTEEQQPFSVRLPIGLTFVDSQQPTPISPEVRAIIEKITTYKIQAKAWQDISDGNIDSGKKKLAAVGTRLLSMGEVDLAAQVQEEILNLEQRGSTSAEGKKRIKYGTRGLTGAID